MKKQLKTVILILNNIFKNQKSIIRFEATETKSIQITIKEDKYIESGYAIMNQRFYDELEDQLNQMELCKPQYNNSYRIFFCIKNGELEWE